MAIEQEQTNPAQRVCKIIESDFKDKLVENINQGKNNRNIKSYVVVDARGKSE